jgi:uncharacterized protein YukE
MSKKKNLKRQLAASQQSVQRMNDSWDRLTKQNLDLLARIERTEEFIQKKDKVISGLKSELEEKNSQLQGFWNGKEMVQIRKDATYWKEAYLISKQDNKTLIETVNQEREFSNVLKRRIHDLESQVEKLDRELQDITTA